jgi:hypothetical protein
MRFETLLLNVERNSTTKKVTQIIEKKANSFEGRGLIPEHVDINVDLFVDGLDVPSRSTIILTGGPRFVAKYSVEEGEIKETAYQQSWMMGRLIVDLDRRFAQDSNALTRLYEALHPIDVSIYAIADAIRKIEGRVGFIWLGVWQLETLQPTQTRIRLESRLLVYKGKISVRLPPSRGKSPIQEWMPKA